MLKYEMKTPSIEELLFFLYITKDDMMPSLDSRVNIEDYAYKLYSNAEFVVCRDENNIVGLVCCYMNRPPKGYISHVGVLKSYRQRGIMRKMFLLLREKANSNSIQKLELEVNSHNEVAIKAYTTIGFVVGENMRDSLYMMCRLCNN